jgi:D-sedoheptulose 7-phosphate isomerase
MTLVSSSTGRGSGADGKANGGRLDPAIDPKLLSRGLAVEEPSARGAVGPEAHLDRLAAGIDLLRAEIGRLTRWGEHLAKVLIDGGRLLAAGNGGSAAEAQHLTAELVGKLCDDRRPLSAIALTAETSSLTAIGNDYGYDRVFARQVEAHGRPGDVLMLLSTSGRSPNLLAAADAARTAGMTSWALTGPLPNPLAMRCDDVLAIPAASQTVQELQLVAVHLIAGHVDAALPSPAAARRGNR